MKKKIYTTTAFMALFVVCFAVVADLNGKWTGSLKLPDNSIFQLNYTFKLDSGKLTGTAHMPQGDANITDGMVNGNDFSFNVTVPNGNAPHTGKFYGDSIVLHIVYQGEHLKTTLTRSN